MTETGQEQPKKKSLLAALAPFGLMAPIVAIVGFLMFGMEGTSFSTKAAAEAKADIQAAIDNPARSEEARARDAGRKPGEVLRFYGVTKGMTVLEVGAGGGYYTEILSAVVGPAGKVIAQNTPSDYYMKNVKATFDPLAARLDNVDPRLGALGDLALDDNSVDAAMIVLMYHHMHYTETEGETLPAATQEKLAMVLAALKLGGVLAVIEHGAPDGSTRANSAALHRVDDATTVADITGQGFTLAEKSDLLHVATDDRAVYWYKTPHQGKTWRLMHKYVKPNSAQEGE